MRRLAHRLNAMNATGPLRLDRARLNAKKVKSARHGKPPLGAHLSIAGGVDKALERALALDCGAVQIFTASNTQWRMPMPDESIVARFRELHEETGFIDLLAHAKYLINLASPNSELRERSIETLIKELECCEILGVPSLILHPGSHMGAGEAMGIRRISGALKRVRRATAGFTATVVLEITAGQGTGLGHTIEQLARIIDRANGADHLGICIDTAHAFAAGYDLRSAKLSKLFWEEIESQIGLERVAAFHLNDSAKALGSRVDRHAHIGQGLIGEGAFRRIMRDKRFVKIPKVLETPKTDDMDRVNLSLLLSFMGKS